MKTKFLIGLALSVYALPCYSMDKEVDESLNKDSERGLQLQKIIPQKDDELALSNIEKKMGGVLVSFKDIEKNIEISLQKQTLSLGQSFAEKVRNEEDKKKLLIEETEKGIEEKSKNLLSIKLKINEQTKHVFSEIQHLLAFLDDKNGVAISSSLKTRLGIEISKGINRFTNNLGIPSHYQDETKYNSYCLIKTSDLDNICNDISQTIISIHGFYQNLDSIWNGAGTIVSKADNARGLIYSNSDSVVNILKEREDDWFGADWYVKLKSKANDADNYVINVKTAADQILSSANSIKSTVSSLELNVSNLKSKVLQKKESPTVIKEYGDFLINKVLKKAKEQEEQIEKNVILSTNQSLDEYFAKGKEYSDKMESLKRNTDKIKGHAKSIELFSNDLDTVSSEVIDFTKNQTGKISLHHNSLIDKGNEFDQNVRVIIEKNKEISLGVIKGKTSEMIVVAKSLAFMVSDKQDQLETYKDQLKDTGETFKHHEGVLIVQHDKHLDDVKGGKQEVLAEKEKLYVEKQSAVQKLENKTIQLENDVKQYQEKMNVLNLQIAKFSGESQMIDGTLKAMLMMMGVNIGELNDLSGTMLAQKCFAKYIEIKK